MRRLTWMRYNHFVMGGSVMHDFHRQPMQRTEYYMPWGVVTVDELSRMS